MSILLNCEGEPCPNPVLRCKRLLEEQSPRSLEVVVDNDAAKENVVRFLSSKNMRIDHTRRDGNLWVITASQISGPDQDAAEQTGACPACAPRILVFLTSDVIGHGDATLGAKLMGNFINTLPELGNALWRIIMVNGAVKLATKSSPCIDKLRELEAAGVSILVCGTCLDFLNS